MKLEFENITIYLELNKGYNIGMSKITFKNPPITEALLDIRVNLDPGFDVKKLEELQKHIHEDFSVKQVNTKLEASFVHKPGESLVTTAKNTPNGYIFKTSDSKKIVQARMDGFTFNRLRPYDSWSSFEKEGEKLWNSYLAIAKPLNITRVALRYINLIEIPLPMSDFKDYILTIPEIAKGVPQGLSEFFMRLVIPDEKRENTAIVTETIELSKLSGKKFPLVFDIDVFRTVDLKPQDQELWKIFNSLRDYKNCIFMNSITDKTKQLFS